MDTAGKFIGVGSVKHGQGITSLVYNLGYNLSKHTNSSVLMLDMNFLFGEIDFLIERKTNNSIDDLVSVAKNQELNKALLMEHTEVLGPNLRIVNSSRIDSADYLKKNAEYLLNIIQTARKNFDIVIVDTTAGGQSPVSRLVSSNCDVFINVMAQNPYILEWYKAYNRKSDIKEINVINMFEDEVYPNSVEIEKKFGIEHVNLSYSKTMRNYYNKKKVEEFVVLDDPYNTDIRLLIDKISAITGIGQGEGTIEQRKKKGIFKRMFR